MRRLLFLLASACAEGSGGVLDASVGRDGALGDAGSFDARGSDAAPMDAAVEDRVLEDGGVVDRIDLWRVDLTVTSSRASIAAVSLVSARSDLSIGVADPDFVVVSYRSSGSADIVEIRPVRFPRVALVESEDESSGSRSVEELSLSESSATVFLSYDPAVARIAVVARDGSEVAERARDSLPVPVGGGLRPAPTPIDHIAVLEPGDEGILPTGLRAYTNNLFAPSTEQLAAVLTSFARMTSDSAAAVRTIAFAAYNRAGIFGTTVGSAIILNRRLSPTQVEETLVHEAAHALTFLGDAPEQEASADWPLLYRAGVRPPDGDQSLLWNLPRAWRSILVAGVEAGVSRPLLGFPGSPSTEAEAVGGGFASLYGATSVYEDIAEQVVTVQFPSSSTGSGVCARFEGVSELNDGLAAPYAKLRLLLGAGFIESSRFEECVRGLGPEGPRGLHAGARSYPFTVSTRLETQGELEYRFVRATNSGRRGAELRVRAAHGLVPSIARLDAWGDGESDLAGPINSLELVDPMGTSVSEAGIVEVLEADGGRARGGAFLVKMVSPSGEVEVVPYATFDVTPVPPADYSVIQAVEIVNNVGSDSHLAFVSESNETLRVAEMLSVREAQLLPAPLVPSPQPSTLEPATFLQFLGTQTGTGLVAGFFDPDSGLPRLSAWRTIAAPAGFYQDTSVRTPDGSASILRHVNGSRTTMVVAYVGADGRIELGTGARVDRLFDDFDFLPGTRTLIATSSIAATIFEYVREDRTVLLKHEVPLEPCNHWRLGSQRPNFHVMPDGRYGFRICPDSDTVARVLRYTLTETETLPTREVPSGEVVPTVRLVGETIFGPELAVPARLAVETTAAQDSIVFSPHDAGDLRFFSIPIAFDGSVGDVQSFEVDVFDLLRSANDPATSDARIRAGYGSGPVVVAPSGQLALWAPFRSVAGMGLPSFAVVLASDGAGGWSQREVMEMGRWPARGLVNIASLAP